MVGNSKTQDQSWQELLCIMLTRKKGSRVCSINSISNPHSTLKMTSIQVVEMSVTANGPSQDCFHPDDQNSIEVCNSLVQTMFYMYFSTSYHCYHCQRQTFCISYAIHTILIPSVVA